MLFVASRAVVFLFVVCCLSFVIAGALVVRGYSWLPLLVVVVCLLLLVLLLLLLQLLLQLLAVAVAVIVACCCFCCCYCLLFAAAVLAYV